MPKIKWSPSVNGGYFFVDDDNNYWHMSANREFITVTDPDGRTGTGWTAETAYDALMSVA